MLEALALASDAIADDLAERLHMVAWDREEQIGAAQRRLIELRELRFHGHGGDPVKIRELADQPLEALELAWRMLRGGRPVHVESEAHACPAVYRIFAQLGELLGHDVLAASPPGELEHEHAHWQAIGVHPRSERIALVQADADRELAAYLLARASLRRTGFDPRVVHRVIVVGPAERLERNLRRLWVGARMGPVDDEQAFAGPVDEPRALRFLEVEAAWRACPDVHALCPGGRLERGDPSSHVYLAPALLRADVEPTRELPEPQGPMLILHHVADEAAGEALLERLSGPDRARLRFGIKPRAIVLREDDRQIHGALLVERLPPGLPEPRP
ncbi:hypothetical protein ACNOYE_08560 [Nannocystaceae bacterium ST9]